MGKGHGDDGRVGEGEEEGEWEGFRDVGGNDDGDDGGESKAEVEEDEEWEGFEEQEQKSDDDAD